MGKEGSAGTMRGKLKEEALIFEPTLLPSPFEEQSPQLCWDLETPSLKVALTLTQFGWSAVAMPREEGAIAGKPLAFEAGSLKELADQVRASEEIGEAAARMLKGRWILAYDQA